MKKYYKKPVIRSLTQETANGDCNVGVFVGTSCSIGSGYYGSTCYTGLIYTTPSCTEGSGAASCLNGAMAL